MPWLFRAPRERLARGACLFFFFAALVACPGSADDDTDPGGTGPGGESGGPPRWIGVEGERLAALPPQAPAESTRFSSSDHCAQCHLAGDGPGVRDAKGRDVSPVGTWKASAMALAARDPYYLATFADELAIRPKNPKPVEALCTRCHAPEASEELVLTGESPSFAMLTTETTPEAHLAREGVACTLCHQIDGQTLGTFPSFSGGFVVSGARSIFGPYTDPLTDPMKLIVNYVPSYGEQIKKSALCATCHTVITTSTDADGKSRSFPEQVPYFEWLASAYSNEGVPGDKAATCQDCHMPAVDEDGVEIETPIATWKGISPRKPFWRHTFAGSNVQLSRLAATDPSWVGLPLTKEDHEAQARASEAMIKRGATIALGTVTRKGDGVELQVVVTNEAGHKFPTGYPSRRAIVHVRVQAPGGEVTYESGRVDEFGRLVARDGAVLEPKTFFPHFDVVEREDQVQIYESVAVDSAGKPTHRPLAQRRYAKDNRLVPAGFNRRNSYSAYVSPVGTDDDPSFGSSDTVTYRIAKAPPGSTVTVELLFQVIRPSDIEALAEAPTPAARKLFDMVTAAPPVPVIVAQATAPAP